MSRTPTRRTARLAEAVEWRLISLLLERPRPGWHEEVAALGGEVRDNALRAAVVAAHDATEGEYLCQLGPGGGVSPREVTYQPFADPGQLLASLAMTYQAFAFQPRAEDPIDHIAVEAGFVGYLLLKEAFATTCGDKQAAATTAAARRDFIAAHVVPVAVPFAERLRAAGASYLVAPAALLAERVPRPRVTRLTQPPAEADHVCGSCSMI